MPDANGGAVEWDSAAVGDAPGNDRSRFRRVNVVDAHPNVVVSACRFVEQVVPDATVPPPPIDIGE